MAGKKIGIVLALDGEKEFKQGLSDAKKETQLLKAELNKLTEEYQGNANSMEFLTKKQENLEKQTEAYQKQVKIATDGLKNAEKTQKKAEDRYDELKKKVADATKALDDMSDAGKSGTKEYKQQERTLKDYQDALDRQGNSLTKCGGKITEWKTKIRTAEKDVTKTNHAIKQNEIYLDEARNSTDGCATSIDKFGKSIQSVEVETKTFKDSLKANLTADVAGKAFSAVVGKAKEAAKYVVDVGSSFEAAMSEVEAVSGASGDQISAISEKAKELGSTTKFSATEAADAFKYMSLAGWSTSDMLSGIDGIMNLAAASGMELANASDMVTDYLSAFGLQASDSARMADLLAYAQAHSNTTAEQLGEAFKNSAANMNAAGQDIETVTSVLEAMANQGLKGSEAGTALSAVMRDINAKMKDGKISIGDASIAIADAQGNYRDLTDILKDVDEATADMSDTERNQALQSTFTSDSIKGLNLVLADGIGNVENYENALRNSRGAAQDMADTMNDNLKGDLTEANSALEGLGIAAYEYVEGPLRGVVQGVTDVISGITDVLTPQKTEFDQFVESVQEANSNLETSIQNADTTMQNAELEGSRIETLGTQLLSLNSVENKSLAQKYQLKEIVSQLGQTIPEISAAYDEQAGSVRLTDEEIQNLISSTKELAIVQASQNALQEVANQLVESKIALQDAETAKSVAANKKAMYEEEMQLLLDLQNEYSQYEAAMASATDGEAVAEVEKNFTNAAKAESIYLDFWNKQLDSGRATMEEYSEAMENVGVGQLENRMTKNANASEEWNDALAKTSGTVEELQSNYDEAEKKVNEYTTAYEEALGSLSGAQEENQKLTDADEQRMEQWQRRKLDQIEGTEEYTNVLNDNTGALDENAKAAQDGADAQKEAAQSILDAYHGYVDEIKSDLQDKINPFEKFDTSEGFGEDVSVEKMTENLDSQIEAFENYQESLNAVKEHVGKEISPEFMKYLEDMGIEGKNTLDHILQTFTDEEPEKVKELNDKWIQSMNMTEEIAQTQAANKAALELAMGEMGSTDLEFSELSGAINGSVTGAIKDELDNAVAMAQQMGVKIPEGLTEGIASGEVTAESALLQLDGAMQGSFDALVQMAQENGIEVGDEITNGFSAGGQQAIDAYSELVATIAGKSPELKAAIEQGTNADGVESSVQSSLDAGGAAIDETAPTYQEKAKTLGDAIAKGIEDGGKDLKAAVLNMVKAGADGIMENQDAYRQAGADLGVAVSEGLQQALSEDGGAVILNPDGITENANEYEAAGEALGDAVAKGLGNKQTEINEALSPDAGGLMAGSGEYESAGQSLGEAFARGISSAAEAAGSAGMSLSEEAIAAIRSQIQQMQEAAQAQAKTYTDALNAARSQAGQAGGNLGSSARSGAAAWQNSFYSIGTNMAAGLASGIRSGQSGAISAAANMAAQALSAAKRELDIHSPSKKFRDDVGRQVGKGFAFGIKDTESLAGSAAANMSNTVYTKAVSWLSKYKKTHKVSLEEEKYYWEQVAKHTKRGTDAYSEAVAKMLKAGVSKTTGSGKKKKSKDAETYYSEIYSAASKYLSNQQVLNDWSLQQELSYWTAVQKQLKSGTQAWYDATKEIKSLQAEIMESETDAAKERIQTQANVQKDLLSKYKVYHNMSAKAEMEYWDIARKQFAAGTDERIEADENYLNAKEEYYEKLGELDEDYAENKKKIDDELAESIEDLQKTYDDAVAKREQEIKSSMSLFESWDAEGYRKDILTENLKTQVEGLRFWEEQLEELSKKKITADLLEELKEMGPEAAANIWSLNQMTAEELEEYNNLWSEKNELAHKQAVEENADLLKETNDAIVEARKTAQDEMAALQKDYRSAIS